jgi:tetratricopeptide (TPR) repeat protein
MRDEMNDKDGRSDPGSYLFRKLAGVRWPMAPDEDPKPLWEEAFRAAVELARGGRLREAESQFRRALEYGEQIGGVALLATLLQFADLYRTQRRYTEAEPLYRQGLALWERYPGPDEALAAHLNNFGEVMHNSGHPTEAEPYVRRSLEVKERLYGPHSEQVALALENLSACLNEQQKWDEAFPLYQRMKEIRGEPFDGSMPI